MWSALYPKAKFIRPIRDNLESLIKANEAEALAWANDGDAMAAFKVYQKTIWYNTLRPFIAIIAQTTEMIDTGDEGIAQRHSILIHLEDDGPTPDALTSAIEKRVQAVDMIITSADSNVLKIGMDANHIAINNLVVASHNYSDPAEDNSRYVQAARLIVKIQTFEI